ncbi:MAG: hypothetical protein HYT31_00150 [Parcubacteria group bacterium]|nr:hypothetical protein [Parcubacteria group bacterium]
MAKEQKEYVREIMAGPERTEITHVHCGFRENPDDLSTPPCGCAIPVHLASNVVLHRLPRLAKPLHQAGLLDIEEAGGFLCDEHLALLKEAGCVPDLKLTTRQIDELGSRRRNESLRDEDRAAKAEEKRLAAAEHERKLVAAKAFAANTFGPRQKVVKGGKNGRPHLHIVAA